MKGTILICFIVLVVAVVISVPVEEEGKDSAIITEDVYLSKDRDDEITRTKRSLLLPRVYSYLARVIKKAIPKLKSAIKINPQSPRRRRKPRRPRRGPGPGEPLPIPKEEPKIKPPMPYPGIPQKKPPRPPMPGPRRPRFKQAA